MGLEKKKALVAMSGGVDSAMAADLTLRAGMDAVGITMRLWSDGSDMDENCRDAAAVCQILGISHRSVDLREDFCRCVVDSFISDYAEGRTPNPCVECNRHLKFGALCDLAEAEGFDRLVTGHYAKIEQDAEGIYRLRKAKDAAKDQSYFLWGIRKEWLPRISFPLGDYTKPEIRSLAAERGLPSASRSDSQDICFVPDGDYVSFIEKHSDLSFPKGNFIDPNGTVLGEHQGLVRYTVGQRKGLGIALGVPAFVREKNPKNNTVTLCSDEELYGKELWADRINLLVDEKELPDRMEAKIRYRHTPAPATVHLSGGHLHILFDTPQRAIALGQSVVLYSGDTVLGGGIIDEV
jgi:tRNA-specific 2-thiouridylase